MVSLWLSVPSLTYPIVATLKITWLREVFELSHKVSDAGASRMHRFSD
jgi:hypothetical protein